MPKIVDHEARRLEILGQSFDLFADRGYSAVSMRKLAGELGVSTGTLYHYFPNKPSLFEAMLRSLAASDVEAALASLEVGMEPEDRLAVIEAYVGAEADHIKQVLWVAIDYQRTVGPASHALIKEVLGVYHAAIADHLCDGDWEQASVLISYIIGVLVHRALVSDGYDFALYLNKLAILHNG
jgi:AcrR family transcriptional regulator